MKRKFIVEVVDIDGDKSEYWLVGSLNGEVVRKKVEYCLDDCLIDLYEFQRSFFDDYEVDCRFDSLRIIIDEEF